MTIVSIKDLSNSILENEMTTQEFITKLGDVSKNKDPFLNKKILKKTRCVVTYSGSWGVPNPTTTTTISIVEVEDLNAYIKIKNKEERIRKRQEIKENKNQDYRFQRNKDVDVTYSTTTLKKVIAEFPGRKISSHSAFGSTTYKYFTTKDLI